MRRVDLLIAGYPFPKWACGDAAYGRLSLESLPAWQDAESEEGRKETRSLIRRVLEVIKTTEDSSVLAEEALS